MNIAIIGAGKFGTAIASIAAQNKHAVTLYVRDKIQAEEINKQHTNSKIFPKIKLANQIKAVCGLDKTLNKADLIFLAVPGNSLPSVLQNIKPFAKDAHFINLSKGMNEHTQEISNEVFKRILGKEVAYGVLSGPNFAHEIIEREPTSSILASQNKKILEKGKRCLQCKFFEIYESTDVVGVEICGSGKNVIAIASGINKSLGLGQNSRAALFTKGFQELGNLLESLGGKKETMLQVSGIGDLFLTATSHESRNYQLGLLLGKGFPLKKALEKIQSSVEGVQTVNTFHKLAKTHHIKMPLVETLYQILHGKKPTHPMKELKRK